MADLCEVAGCSKEKFKTVPKKAAEKLFKVNSAGNKVHLCKDHYKRYKKETKTDRKIERLTWV